MRSYVWSDIWPSEQDTWDRCLYWHIQDDTCFFKWNAARLYIGRQRLPNPKPCYGASWCCCWTNKIAWRSWHVSENTRSLDIWNLECCTRSTSTCTRTVPRTSVPILMYSRFIKALQQAQVEQYRSTIVVQYHVATGSILELRKY